MYYIGICDDDPMFISYIKRLFGAEPQEFEFYEYLSGEALISDLGERERFDLLILDILMPGMDGNLTAREFRKQFPHTLLVFCSGVYLPTVESFEAIPYRYWLKEYTESRMKSEIADVLSEMKKRRVQPYIMGKINNRLIRLSPEQIFYIAIAKRGSILYCSDTQEKYRCSQKLSDLFELLKDFGFAYAHNSYIVNLKHVVAVDSKELELENREKLSISRARAKEFKKAFAICLAKKYGTGTME